jgi:CBS domain-containing membrane protein
MSKESDRSQSSKSPSKPWLFVPILAGAKLRERLIACLGGLLGIGLTGLVCGLMFGHDPHLPLLVAPMGASAVLLFAVPSSPLAQPWSIIGGNTLSACAGLLVRLVIHDPVIGTAAAVALAIAVMSFTRCLHPPGGAAALTAVLGGPAVDSWGLLFPLVPVALNSCVLVGLGLLFHRLSRRNYPHTMAVDSVNAHSTADPPPSVRVGVRKEDIDAALANLNETFDIDRRDIKRLLQEAELQAMIRTHGKTSCADIMSRDVITIRPQAMRKEAMALLLRHDIRVLPVTDTDGRLLGTVGLPELAESEGEVGGLLAVPTTTSAESSAVSLLPQLTDGRTHAVIITDAENRVLGLISQTDLLSAVREWALAAFREDVPQRF